MYTHQLSSSKVKLYVASMVVSISKKACLFASSLSFLNYVLEHRREVTGIASWPRDTSVLASPIKQGGPPSLNFDLNHSFLLVESFLLCSGALSR